MGLEEHSLGSNAKAKIAKAAVGSRIRHAIFGLEPGSHIADVSEFQGNVNWGAYGPNRHAVVVRASSGYGPDLRWGTNRDGARATCMVRGFYQYLAPGKDVTLQANQFCDLVGSLTGPEFVVLDFEDPGFGGDQRAAALSWFGTVRARLHTSPNQEWFYSYWPFVQEHFGGGLGWLGSRPSWLAGYSVAAPWWRPQVIAWQHTDGQYGDTQCQPAPGLPRCDCSVYAGTIPQLATFVSGAPPAPAYHPSGGQEDRSHVALVTRPIGRGVDAVVVGVDGNVWHASGDSAITLQNAGWENLGSPFGAKSVSGGWTADGSQFVVACHGNDNGMWIKFWDSHLGWTPNWTKQSTGVLAP